MRGIEHPEIKPDLVGTAAMYLGFDAMMLFPFPLTEGDLEEMPDYWYDCLNICITVIQPIIKDEEYDWFCDAIEMFSESGEEVKEELIY